MKKLILSFLGVAALAFVVTGLTQTPANANASIQPADASYSTCISRDRDGNCTATMDIPNGR